MAVCYEDINVKAPFTIDSIRNVSHSNSGIELFPALYSIIKCWGCIFALTTHLENIGSGFTGFGVTDCECMH